MFPECEPCRMRSVSLHFSIPGIKQPAGAQALVIVIFTQGFQHLSQLPLPCLKYCHSYSRWLHLALVYGIAVQSVDLRPGAC